MCFYIGIEDLVTTPISLRRILVMDEREYVSEQVRIVSI